VTALAQDARARPPCRHWGCSLVAPIRLPWHLLSGLLFCGCCQEGYTLVAAGRYGCAGRRSKGTCTNDRTIGRVELDERILSALKQRLLTPELEAEFSRTYHQECNRAAADADGLRSTASTAMAAVQRKIDGIMAAIEDGLYRPATGRQ